MSSCSRPRSEPPASTTLLIAAAADLAAIQHPLLEAFESGGHGRFEMVLGSSGLLARQIEQGAPYDVYLSANESFVDGLVRAGKLQRDSVVVYALGRLGLWSASGRVRDLDDLASERIRHVALANPAHAPYGAAARQALEKLDLWRELEPKIVFGENVRQALQYAESGNADAVVTAWSLVSDRGGVLVPAELHAPIRQSGGVVTGSPRSALARRFLEFLAGPEARKVLESHGFAAPDS